MSAAPVPSQAPLSGRSFHQGFDRRKQALAIRLGDTGQIPQHILIRDDRPVYSTAICLRSSSIVR